MAARPSAVGERIFDAALRLAAQKPIDRIGLSEIARAAGVSWPTVKRHLGGRSELRRYLVARHPELSGSDTRTRLLEAAARVFARSGYHRATLDEVAAAAGATKGAVYWHFDGKRALLLALVDECAARSGATAGSSLPAEAEAADEEVFRGVSRRDWSRLLVELAALSRDEDVRHRLAALLGGERAAAETLVRERQVAGELPQAVEPGVLGALLVAVRHGASLSTLVDSGAPGPEELQVALSRLLGRPAPGASGRSRMKARTR